MISPAAFAARLSGWRPPPSSLGIVMLGQAGVALRSGDDLVLIDPFLSPRPDRVAEPIADPGGLVGVTAILATHEHGDHLDLPIWTVLAGASPAARFVVPEPLVPLATGAGIPADRVIGATIGAAVRVGDARVTPVPARHGVHVDDGYSLGPRWAGYVVELDGVRLYHAGDTLADGAIVRAVRALRPDIALVPINGRDREREARDIVGNMTPPEAARLARDLAVSLAIPMHFDGMQGNEGRPDAFVRAMRRHHPSASVWVPRAGAGLVWPTRDASWHATSL